MFCIRGVRSWMLVAAGFWAAAAGAQVPTAPSPAPPPAGVQAPQPVDAAGIVSQADTDERLAIAVLERAGPPDPMAPLLPELESIARAVDARLHLFSPAQLRRLPVLRLESLDRHWTFDAKRLERWRKNFHLATAGYANDAAELARRRAAWELTRTREADQLSPVLLARVDAVAQLLAQAEGALAPVMGRQIAVGTRANALDTRLQGGQQAVVAAIADIDGGLLRLDAPPLWRAGSSAGQGDMGQSIRDGLQIETEFANAYSQANLGNQVALHVLQLLMLVAVVWAWRRHRPAVREDRLEPGAARVLGRPFSTWLLLCAVATMVMEPDAPMLTRQLWMVLALVPVLRLLPPGSRELLDIWPVIASALYLLAGVGSLVLSSSLAFRYYTLGLGAVALLATAWLLWRAYRRGHVGRTGRIGQALRAAAWLGAALLVIAMGCNVVGNVSLSEMLTNAVIDSAYFGLLLYVCVTVLRTLLHLLLNRPGLERFALARAHAPPLMQLLERLVLLSAVVGWLLYAMESLRILRPVYALLARVLGHEFSVGDFSLSLGHVLTFVLALVVAFWASRVTRLLLQDLLHGRAGTRRGMGSSIASLASYAVLLLGVVVALSAAGFKSTQLALVFGALGVGIGFGLQNVVNNFVSGLILMFERPIQPGDVVEVGTTSGRVRDIGMRATRIKTFDGADVIVPNGTLLSERLVNWTLMDRNRRIEVTVGVAYGSDPAQVLTLLETCAATTPGIASEPACVVLFTGFGESSLDFVVRAWTADYDHWAAIRSALVLRIHAALGEAGIEIPFPQRDVHVRLVPP